MTVYSLHAAQPRAGLKAGKYWSSLIIMGTTVEKQRQLWCNRKSPWLGVRIPGLECKFCLLWGPWVSHLPSPMLTLLVSLLLLLLSRFSRVWLCVTPWTAAYQAPPSLGFSRQEHWSGLPFPSPMHESGKWKVKVKSLSRVWLLATPWTAAYQAPPSMGFSKQEYWSGVPLPSPISLSVMSNSLYPQGL